MSDLAHIYSNCMVAMATKYSYKVLGAFMDSFT